MYLRDADECEVLLRLIDDCDRLVENKAITAGAAYTVVSEAAKHHSDHPGEKRKRAEERERERAEKAAKSADVQQGQEPTPVPEVVDAPEIDAVNAF